MIGALINEEWFTLSCPQLSVQGTAHITAHITTPELLNYILKSPNHHCIMQHVANGGNSFMDVAVLRREGKSENQ